MQRRSLPRIGLGPALAVIIPLVGFEYLIRLPQTDTVLMYIRQHFYIVSVASILAGVIAAVFGLAARRQRNIAVSFLALAFMSLGFLFSIHGLATPGLLLPASNLPGVAAQLSIAVTAVWLLLSSSPSDLRTVVWLARWQGWLVPAWGALMLIVMAVSLAAPHLWDFVPLNAPPLVWFAASVTMVMLLLTAVRYWQSFAYSRFPLQLTIVYASGWLAASQWMMTRGSVWHFSWWLYHFLFVAATGAMVVGLLWQYAQGTSLTSAVRGLFLADPRERLEAGLSTSVRALVVATEARDPYTAGHAYRVTLGAVRIAEAMGLPGEKLRALAQGGILHDVGKIEVPDQILNKPSRLIPDERPIVEKHPVTGYEMCKRLGFMKDELGAIRHHHERWDGTGYPDGLAGGQIPLLARILAVADVYDALTSSRSYRGEWTHEQARAYVLQASGSQFDSDVVRVWDGLTASGPMVEKAPGPFAPAPRPA